MANWVFQVSICRSAICNFKGDIYFGSLSRNENRGKNNWLDLRCLGTQKHTRTNRKRPWLNTIPLKHVVGFCFEVEFR
jgi:hypothetical protein